MKKTQENLLKMILFHFSKAFFLINGNVKSCNKIILRILQEPQMFPNS